MICFVPRYVPLSLPGELYHSPRLLLLDGYGTISQELKNKIEHEMVPERVEQWIKLAAKVDSIDQFIKEM